MTLLASVAGDVTLQDSGGGTVLTFNTDPKPAGGYELVAFDEAGQRRRRDVATSPYVDGAAEITSVRDELRVSLTVRIVGTSTADCRTKRDALLAAAEARRWGLVVELDGTTDEYDCYAADWSATRPTAYLLSYRTEVTLDIPARRR